MSRRKQLREALRDSVLGEGNGAKPWHAGHTRTEQRSESDGQRGRGRARPEPWSLPDHARVGLYSKCNEELWRVFSRTEIGSDLF